MQAVLYYCTLPFLYGISMLPFWLLYRVSDGLFVLVYLVLGYRKGVVRQNLMNSFPEKSPKEISKIQRSFYRYFCDLIVETVKTMTISPRQLKKTVSFPDIEVFERHSEKNQSVIIVMGHLGNWEIGGARFALEACHRLFVVYHPLSNPYFDRLMYRTRTRLGNGLYAMKNTLRGMVADRKELTATAFVADQTPSPNGAYWMTFLNQETPVFTGTGKIATKFNYPVIYVRIERPRRGRYVVRMEDLIEEPRKVEPDQVMQSFIQRLEKDIQRMPEIWLWTHRRWKHKKPQMAQAVSHA